MKREAFEKLRKWKTEKNRKPLILRGARQVGKTWLMREFGRACYGRTIYAALDADATIRAIFEQDMDAERIIRGLELASGGRIDPDDTLIILDEIQEVPRALSSLKYFCERMPQYHVVAAGSLLGVALHEWTSFPVGKVDFLPLHPLTFREFLGAIGKENLLELLETLDFNSDKGVPAGVCGVPETILLRRGNARSRSLFCGQQGLLGCTRNPETNTFGL